MGTDEYLKITYSNSEAWLPKLAEQLKADASEYTAHFDNEMGKGSFYRVDIDWGLQLRKIEVRFLQPVELSNEPTKSTLKEYYVLLANLSEQLIEAHTGETQFKLGYSSHNGIYFSSPFLSATFSFKANVSYRLLFVIISHDRVKNFIERQPESGMPFLKEVLSSDKPLYHAEPLDAGLESVLRTIDRNLNDDRPNNLLLHSKILDLCYRILQKIDQRKHSKPTTKIHPRDVAKLNEVRRDLLANYQDACPPIPEISQKIAMSPTKFKTLFRQMFGYTYYQFYKNVRLHKAHELLEQGKMNVSEVAYLLGYNNTSKFSKAFKEMFSVTPGKIATH